MEMNNGMYGMGGYYDPNSYLNLGFQGQPMYFGNQQLQPINSSLTDEEIQMARQDNSNGSPLNLNVDQVTIIEAMCNHRYKGQDVVQVKADGSGAVWCPICGASWSIEELTKEDVQEIVNKLIDQMQIAKWAGNIPTNIVRDYFPIIPLIAKFPDVYDYAMKNFNRMNNANGIFFNTDAMPYAQYNSMFPGGSMNYNVVNPYYQQPYQPNMMMGQPQMSQPQMGQMANPAVNPMQAQAGFNPQFVNQQNMMLYNQQYQQAGQMPPQNGQYMNQPTGYYQQPYQPNMMGQPQMGQMYQPNFGVAQPQQQAQQTPPTQAAPVTTETKAEL